MHREWPVLASRVIRHAPQPFGVAFTGMACSEGRLLELAYGFEQATKRRVVPPAAPSGR